MINRKHISKRLQITEQYISMLLAGKRQVSWPLAARLAELFPCKTIEKWKKAAPAEIEHVFNMIEVSK